MLLPTARWCLHLASEGSQPFGFQALLELTHKCSSTLEVCMDIEVSWVRKFMKCLAKMRMWLPSGTLKYPWGSQTTSKCCVIWHMTERCFCHSHKLSLPLLGVVLAKGVWKSVELS